MRGSYSRLKINTCARTHVPQRVRMRTLPLSLLFHVVQFQSASKNHAFIDGGNHGNHVFNLLFFSLFVFVLFCLL